MPIPAPLLNGIRREYTIGHLVDASPVEQTRPGERQLLGLVLPPWQREEKWSDERKCRFVEGIFLGFGCGSYVVNGADWRESGAAAPMSGWLLDGQQRISAIRDFLDGSLVIFGDVRYPSLMKSEQMRFCRQSFPCFELEYCGDETKLIELYDRLNFGGIAHTESDRVRY